MSKKIRLHIGGMTCVNCQNKIEKGLLRAKGVISAGVSYNKAAADVVYDEKKTSLQEITGVIERLGYRVIPDGKAAGPGIAKIAGMLAVIILLYVLLQATGVLNLLVPGQLADTGMGYGMLFVIGLITSVHCIAMCGGINLSQCIPRKAAEEADGTGKLAAFRPALAYNLGRVVSYTAVGFILGLAGFLVGGGSQVGLSATLQGALKILAGLVMVVMGINMLGLFPWLRRFTVRMPDSLARKVGKKKSGTGRPFVVGILNGFMPCGPLQSMWIVALASGDPFSGALSMFLFSLGTVPLMLGLGSIVSALGRRFANQVMTVGAVLVVVLGLAMLSQGGALSGWLSSGLLLLLIVALSAAGVLLSIPVQKAALKIVTRAAALVVVAGACALWYFHGAMMGGNSAGENHYAQANDDVQVVHSTLSSGGYPNITVQVGIPVKWVIDAPEGSINGCNGRMLIPDYGIEYTFHTGENIIEFTPTSVGTVRYSCWMGMIRANIFVTDESGSVPAAASGNISVPTPAGYRIPAEALAVAAFAADENGREIQEVSIALTDRGFSPSVIVVQRDLMVYWNIENSRTDAGTGTELLVPRYSTQLLLGTGLNQLSLYPTESFDVSTGDNCFYSYVKVVDDLAAIDEAAIRDEVAAFETLIYPAETFGNAGRSCCCH